MPSGSDVPLVPGGEVFAPQVRSAKMAVKYLQCSGSFEMLSTVEPLGAVDT